MAQRDYDLNDLEVIGYASVLTSELVPRIVPPIFRSKTQLEIVLLPPYHLEGDRVCDVWDGREEDLERAVRAGQVTRIDSPMEARTEHHLWIDEALRPHYEPAPEVEQELLRLAHRKVHEAQDALAEGRLDDALRLSQNALSADDRCLNALLIKACVYELRGEMGKVKILNRLAERITPGTDLFSWVALFSKLVKASSSVTLRNSISSI